MPVIRLVVGLGNPGERYRNTWHNIGFRTLELLAERARAKFKPWRHDSLIADYGLQGSNVALMLPTTYMNRSGSPVAGWLNYFKASPEEMLVIYDDHDLPLGKLRIRNEGTSGGHRGVEDIIKAVGINRFPRIRIGIETGRERFDLADQVLTPIPKSLEKQVGTVVQIASEAAELIISGEYNVAMNRYNGLVIE